MPKNRSQQNNQSASENPPQAVDASMKGLLEQQAPLMIPRLLKGAAYVKTLDIEIIRPPMRADRVYLILYHGQLHILHLEFQVGRDTKLRTRMLIYCGELYHEYDLPVISMIIYPFPTTIAKPPLSVMSGTEEIMRLNYRILLLYEEGATTYVKEHAVEWYALLPTMTNVDAQLIKQAIEEMQAFYEDERNFKDQMAWMTVFFKRTGTILPQEKQRIEEVFKMLGMERIWDESPLVQQERARSQLEEARSSIEMVVKVRFPSLVNLARQKVSSLTQLETLHLILQQIAIAPDEESARRLLLPQEPS